MVELGGTSEVPEIKKITCVFDCGIVVNPQLVKGQVEGSLIWALQPILFAPIQVENGRVLQSNFDDYEMPRMSDIPDIHIELIDSDMSPSGAGEPAVPGLARQQGTICCFQCVQTIEEGLGACVPGYLHQFVALA